MRLKTYKANLYIKMVENTSNTEIDRHGGYTFVSQALRKLKQGELLKSSKPAWATV